MQGAPQAYSKGMQIIHWLTALLILLLIPIGWSMVRMDMNATKTTLFQVHVSLGLLVLLLTAIRIILRFLRPVPPTPDGITGMRKLLFQGIHLLQYLTLIALVVSGVSILLNSGVGLLPTHVTPQAINIDLAAVKFHSLLYKFFILLIVLHVAGVLEYQFRHQDVLSRMGVPWFASKHS